MTEEDIRDCARRPSAADVPRLAAELLRARRVLKFYGARETYVLTSHAEAGNVVTWGVPIASDRGRRARWVLETEAPMKAEDEDTQPGDA